MTPFRNRPEIDAAVNAIMDRIAEGYSTTAIVMPPRTGKSDVIRKASVVAGERYGAVSIALEPWIFLRDQIIDLDHINAFRKRHRIMSYITGKLESGLFDDQFYLQQPVRNLWSLTIPGAAQEASLINLEQAAKNLKELDRLLLIFIDEGHLVSSDNMGWGEVAERLKAAGAHIVLLTGTPYRSDNIKIFGFETNELSREAISYKIPAFDSETNPIFRHYSAVRALYEMKADYEFKRKDAWGNGYLSRMQARWIAFYANGNVVDENTDENDARKALAKAVRDPQVIRQIAEILVDDVMERRHSAPASAAIVFVGNDSVNEAQDETHTNTVKTIIEAVWRQKTGTSPIVTTAMLRGMKQKEAAARISRFVGTERMPGIGDVLIVKQMGSVGLDPPRIKTAADLSLVRTLANTTQRWMRVATPWFDETGKPLATHGTLILPSDPITKDLYRFVVANEGGEQFASLQGKIHEKDEDREPGQPLPDLIISNPFSAGVTDLVLDTIGPAKDQLVTRVLQQQPRLALIYDRVEIARLLDSGQITIIDGDEVADQGDSAMAIDVQSDVELLWADITEWTKKFTDQRFNYGTERDQWVHCRRMITGDAKRRAGINVELRACHDIPKLTEMRDYIRARYET